MAKLINCECGYVVRGETDDELIRSRGRISSGWPKRRSEARPWTV